MLLVLAAGSALVGSLTGDLGAPSDSVWLAAFGLFAVVGGPIVRHQPRNPVGWLFVAAGLGTVLGAFLTGLATLIGAPVVATLALLPYGWSWVLGTALSLLLFPTGRLPSRRWRPVMWLVGLLLVVLTATIIAATVPAVAAVPERLRLAETVMFGCEMASALVTLIAIGSLIGRWWSSDGQVRRQLAWLAFGGLVILVLVAIELVLGRLLEPSDERGAYFEAAVVAILPLATYIAIVRHRLFDIRVVLRRSLVYAILSLAVVATYAASLAAASQLLDVNEGIGASLVASAVVAVALSPVKERLDRTLDRALFGDRKAPERPLAALGAQWEGSHGPSEMLVAAARTVQVALRLPYVRIDPVDGEPVTVGEPVADPVSFALISHGEQEGTLYAGPRARGERFDSRELALLADLSRHVALLVRTTRLSADLYRSRERIVSAREQERLRLRRDLHDGLGPVLAGITLQFDALRPHLADNPVAGELFDRIKSELRRCVSDVRRTVDGLRPADLDQLGLAGVVAEHARSLSASGVVVDLACADDLSGLNPAAEVATYRIVTEAMTNVVRHANARTCWVRIDRERDRLEVSIADDGCGIDHGGTPGVGLASMRDRADELGGTLQIGPRPGGGTQVVAVIPAGAGASHATPAGADGIAAGSAKAGRRGAAPTVGGWSQAIPADGPAEPVVASMMRT